MARFSLLAAVFLFSASFRLSEGGCHQPGAIPMCEVGTRVNQTIFIDANTTIAANEECTCEVSRNSNGQIEIGHVGGSISNCQVKVTIDTIAGVPLHEINCFTERQSLTREVNTNLELKMTGPGTMDTCIFMSSQGFPQEALTITCKKKVQVYTTLQPPTTTTQEPPPTTTRAPGPTTTQEPGPTTTQAPGPTTTQEPGPTTTQEPGATTTQAPGPTTTQSPGATTTKAPGPTTTNQPGPTTTNQPGQTTTQSPGQTTTQSPSTGQTEPASSQEPGQTTTTQPPRATEPLAAFAKFPVPEVAGGVAGGILLMILLVVCITCCTRSKTREADEESLKSHASQSPRPEMTENKEGYAFDNLLYHASQRDESGKDGKSLTPTVSEGSTHDEAAFKGFEELYASVNKNITDSTDIM